jgi:hypothetical protein
MLISLHETKKKEFVRQICGSIRLSRGDTSHEALAYVQVHGQQLEHDALVVVVHEVIFHLHNVPLLDVSLVQQLQNFDCKVRKSWNN